MCLYRLPDGKQGEQAVAGVRVLIQYPLGSTQIPHLTVITDAWRIGAGDAFYFSPVRLNKRLYSKTFIQKSGINCLKEVNLTQINVVVVVVVLLEMRLASLMEGIDLSTVLSSESILMYIMRQLLFLTMTRELLLMWLYVNMTCNQCGNPLHSWCHSFVIKAWRLRKQRRNLSVSIMEKP